MSTETMKDAKKKAIADPILAGLEPMLSIDDLMAVLQCSRRLVDRLRSSGDIPRPDKMVGRFPRWKAATIRAWIDTR